MLFSDELKIDDTTLPIISQLAECIPGGFFIYHADGMQELIYFNSHLPTIFGCDTAEEFKQWVGNSFMGIVHPEDYAKNESDIQAQINKSVHKLDHVKYRFIRRDGSVGMMDDYGHFSHSETFGDIYYVFVQDITEQDREEQEHKENIRRIMALEDNFGSLYDVDLESCRYVNYVNNQLLSQDQVDIMVDHGDFFKDTIKNAELVVYPDDVEGVIKVLNRDFIRKTLEKQNSFDWYYRLLAEDGYVWARLRFVYKDDTKKHIIVGAFNAEKEMAAKLQAEQTRKDLIASISGSESAYIVNPEGGKFTVIVQNSYLDEHYPSDETYTQSITRYIENDIFVSDRKDAQEALSLENLVRHLAQEKEYRFRFRDISKGTPSWYVMRAVKLSDTEILIAFSDKNSAIIGQLMYEKMIDSYFGLYYVDLDSGLAQIIKTGHPEVTGEAGRTVEYSSFIRKIASTLEDEVADFLLDISDVNYVRSYFRTTDTGYMINKSPVFDVDKWAAITGFVLERHEDGMPSRIALGFSLLDEKASEKEEAKLKLQQTTKELEAALHHNVVLNQILKAGPWMIKYDCNNEVTKFEFTPECLAVLRNDVDNGFQWLKLIHPEDIERVNAAFMSCMTTSGNEALFDEEYRILSRNGYYHWMRSAGRMKRNDDGSGEFYGICADIDESVRRREEEKLKLKEALAAADKEKLRNDALHDIIHSGKWAFFVNEQDEIIGSDVSEEANSILRNDVAPDGHSWLNIVHPDDRDYAAAAFNATIRDHSCKTPYDVNYRMIDRNGVYRWFHSAGRIIRSEDGHGEFFGIHVDINEQMEEQQKRLLGAVPLSSDVLTKARIGLWAFELDEGQPPRMYADEAMLSLLGLAEQVPPEEIYHAWYDHIDKDAYDFVHDAVEKMGSGEHAEVQYPWHYPDGRTIVVRCGGVRNFEYTKGIRIEGTHQDVTATLHFDEKVARHQQLELEASKARAEMLTFISDHEPDVDKFMNYFGKKVLEVTGCDQVIFRDLNNHRIVVDGEGISDVPQDICSTCPFARFQCDDYGENGVVLMNDCADGFHGVMTHPECPAKSSYMQKVYSDDKLVGLLTIHYLRERHEFSEHDLDIMRTVGAHLGLLLIRIAAKKSNMEKLQAESSSAAKTQFLFNMSHDIRTPMNAILGYTDLALRHRTEEERVDDCLAKIKASGGHLLNLINDILEMSRIEAGTLELSSDPLDIRQAIMGVEAMSQVLAAPKNIKFEVAMGCIRNPYIYADELHINEVLINIISNAIKYSDEDGRVRYSIEQIEDAIGGIARYRFEIADNGIGMSEEFQQHIFETFSREKSEKVAKREGTGIGLSIVKRIVDLAGGTIEVRSKLDVGSTFIVELPFRVLDAQAIIAFQKRQNTTPEETVEAFSLKGRQVLLVEDNEMNREIAMEILVEEGMRVEEAEDGSKAVEALREKGPDYYDFILMDIQMPVMNGYEATKTIRDMYPKAKIPIIALSANAFSEDKAASLAAGMNDHVAKPIKIKELLTALAKFL